MDLGLGGRVPVGGCERLPIGAVSDRPVRPELREARELEVEPARQIIAPSVPECPGQLAPARDPPLVVRAAAVGAVDHAARRAIGGELVPLEQWPDGDDPGLLWHADRESPAGARAGERDLAAPSLLELQLHEIELRPQLAFRCARVCGRSGGALPSRQDVPRLEPGLLSAVAGVDVLDEHAGRGGRGQREREAHDGAGNEEDRERPLRKRQFERILLPNHRQGSRRGRAPG